MNDCKVDGISVVTTTWNERENRRTHTSHLPTLQNIPREIIVIDDSSSDGTP